MQLLENLRGYQPEIQTAKAAEMIRIEHLSKRFGDLVVLKDINTEIKRGRLSPLSVLPVPEKHFCVASTCRLSSGGSIYIDGVNILDKKADG